MKIYMINFLYFLILVLSLNNLTFAMEKKPLKIPKNLNLELKLEFEKINK